MAGMTYEQMWRFFDAQPENLMHAVNSALKVVGATLVGFDFNVEGDVVFVAVRVEEKDLDGKRCNIPVEVEFGDVRHVELRFECVPPERRFHAL